jgi:PTH1 family peptidyl-tRNA hydrolase
MSAVLSFFMLRYALCDLQVGFMVVDSIARSANIDMRKLEKTAAVGRGELHGRKIILAKPMTFMNNSGESVAALARFYKVPPPCYSNGTLKQTDTCT